MTSTHRPSGMRAFAVIWLGQIFSLLGTAMTNFGVGIWAFEREGRATDLTLISFFFLGAYLVVTPFAGVAVDRFNRKVMMILSDLAAGVVTVVIFALFALGRLEIWHLYISATIQGAFNAFQWPAFSTAITMMLPKEHYTRADSMMNVAMAGSGTVAPMLAASLMGWMGDRNGLLTILLIDCISLVIAVVAVLTVQVPQPMVSAEGEAVQGGVFQQIVFGFRYILERPSLLGLQLVFFLGNFLVSVPFALQIPMILSRTGGNEMMLGTVQAIGSLGGVIGGAAISAWGGFKRRVHGVLLGWFLTGGVFTMLFGLGRGSPAWMALPIWGTALFLSSFVNPLINSSNQAIWQTKVPPDIQGRVFSARAMIAWAVMPLANLIAGPLADYVMEPAMRDSGALAGTFGWLTGVGPGAGMSLLFILAGMVVAMVGLGGYLFPAIRNAEDILPDHDAVGEASA
jgi:DHA3 family macrolide efflux protein-like MFS transporter